MSLFKKITHITFLLTNAFWLINANATTYAMPAAGNDIVGEAQTVIIKRGDTLDSLSAKYDLSWYELVEANQNINPRILPYGQTIVIPTQHILPPYRQGIVINLPELRLYYFTPDGKYVMTYPVALGRRNWQTPLGVSAVVKKVPNPVWHIPKSIQEFAFKQRGEVYPDETPPGPDNPLGDFALFLTKRGYVIHGTNQQDSVGRYLSSGCIRLRKDDIKELFNLVNPRTKVTIVNHSIKAGWLGTQLYLKAQLPLFLDAPESEYNYNSVSMALDKVIKNHPAEINWQKVKAIVIDKSGIPQVVGVAAGAESTPALANNKR